MDKPTGSADHATLPMAVYEARFRKLVEADPTIPDWGRQLLLTTYTELRRSVRRSR
jgi:hypothetical protein